MDTCPCWTAELGWEEGYWAIDEMVPSVGYSHSKILENFDWYTRLSMSEEVVGGDCMSATLYSFRLLEENDCQFSWGSVTPYGSCDYDIAYFWRDVTDEEMHACDLAVQQLLQRTIENQ